MKQQLDSSVHLVRPEVLIVGSGPAGLRAAEALGHDVGSACLVIEREDQPGGLPRHAHHTGFGIRDLKRVLPGPKYAQILTRKAEAAGADIQTSTMVTDWNQTQADENSGISLNATSPHGLLRIEPRALVLATGARERPRNARMVPGDRGAGVFTTGQLQNMVHLRHLPVGKSAVVIGTELVSWSAVLTLREAGVKTICLVTPRAKGESYGIVRLVGTPFFQTRVRTYTRVLQVIGKPRVTGVVVEDTRTHRQETIKCDTVVFTADWIPDNELSRLGGLSIDKESLSPIVDISLRTTREGVFAAGNLAHPVDVADAASWDGLKAAESVRRFLQGGATPSEGAEIVAEAPLRWIAPRIVRPDDHSPARGRFLSWTDDYIATPMVTVEQDGKVLKGMRLPWAAAPGRAFRIPQQLFANVDPLGGKVTVRMV